jgi:hypothetical protein
MSSPTIVKAYYRGAKAASELSHWEHAIVLGEGGLVLDPDNEALREIIDKVSCFLAFAFFFFFWRLENTRS